MPFKLNIAAAILFPSIVPFTLAFLKPTNDKLFEKETSLAGTSLDDKAAEAGVTSGETTHALIDKWAMLNLARAAITGVGAIFAIWAALDKRETGGYNSVGLTSGANRMG